MTALSFVLPQFLVFLAFAGAGYLVQRLCRLPLPEHSALTEFCMAYFLGQGILGIALTLLGVVGVLQRHWLFAVFLPCAACCVFFLYKDRNRWRTLFYSGQKLFNSFNWGWRLYTVLLAGLIVSGISSLGTSMHGDASAFYLAYSKLLAFTGHYIALPGYEAFSQVGLLAETFIAALQLLGMPDASARIYAYVNFLPTLVILASFAKRLGLGSCGIPLLLGAAVTSSCVVLLWGCGKTDLYAVGPALAAFLYAGYSWEQKRFQFLGIAGFMAGLACVFKLSYLPCIGVSLSIFSGWPLFFQFSDSVKKRNGQKIRQIPLILALGILYASAGFLVGFSPLLIKNQMIFGSWIGVTDSGGAFFSTKTTIRILLTYPLALVLGDYWAQFGTVSVLYLIAVPFLPFLPRAEWRNSQFTAISLASVSGILGWIVLFPSYITPRYFLFVLLLAAIPLMAGLAQAARQRAFWNICIPLTGACVIALAFAGYVKKDVFKPMAAIEYMQTGSDPTPGPEAWAGKYISEHAGKDDRVCMLTWQRYWLRPDLILTVSAGGDSPWLQGTDENAKTPEEFWARMRAGGFTYVMWDTKHFKSNAFSENLAAIPPEITVTQLECRKHICVYKIDYTE